jgi:hypothetical protein
MVLYGLQTILHRKIQEDVQSTETTKSRMQNVNGCTETHEPEKLYHKQQENNRAGDRKNKELQGTQRSHLNETANEQLEQLYTINDEEKMQNSEPTTVVEMEAHQQRCSICKLKEKIESTYYQVTHTDFENRPRLQKLQNVFNTKEIMNTTSEAMAEILANKDLNMTEFKPLHLHSSNGPNRRNKWTRKL